LIALALVCAPVSPLFAQHVLNLRDADIRAFIQDASRVTGRTFIIDPGVQGRVSVVTERPLSRSEYFELFLSTMRANGFVAVPVAGGAIRIQPIAGAALGEQLCEVEVRAGAPRADAQLDVADPSLGAPGEGCTAIEMRQTVGEQADPQPPSFVCCPPRPGRVGTLQEGRLNPSRACLSRALEATSPPSAD